MNKKFCCNCIYSFWADGNRRCSKVYKDLTDEKKEQCRIVRDDDDLCGNAGKWFVVRGLNDPFKRGSIYWHFIKFKMKMRNNA